MRVGEHEIEWRGDRVEIVARDGRTATARWANGALLERSGALAAELERTARWHALEEALRLEAEALIEATTRAAYDARGVDVTQIVRMLALSPSERLSTLDAQRQAIVRLRRDARIT